ncbi:hypothetical protein WA158_005109 [Blastocystis sp. Blastoise]
MNKIKIVKNKKGKTNPSKAISKGKPVKNNSWNSEKLKNESGIVADEQEIEYLSDKLGLKSNKDKKKLLKEYVKEDGYDEDFVSFLDDLDNILDKDLPDNLDDDDVPEGMDASGVPIVVNTKSKKNSQTKRVYEESEDDNEEIESNGYDDDEEMNNDGYDDEEEINSDDEEIDSNEDDEIVDNDDEEINSDEVGSLEEEENDIIDDEEEDSDKIEDFEGGDEDIDSDEALGSEDGDLIEELKKKTLEKKQKVQKVKKPQIKRQKMEEEEEEENDDDMELLASSSDKEEEEEEDNNNNKNNNNEEEDNDNDSDDTLREDKKISNEYIMVNGEKVYVPKTDIYGNPLKGQEEIEKTYATKYIPPHLRNQGNEKKTSTLDIVDAKEKAEIKKQLISAINKLSIDNFLTICQSIISVCKNYPRNSIKVVLTEVILQYSMNSVKVISTFIRLYAGILVAVGNSLGGDINAYYTETIVKKYMSEYEVTLKEKKNNNAFEIRKDCPDILKEVILLLQRKSKEQGYDKNSESDENSRIRLMLDHIYELKNNKQTNTIQQDIEKTLTIKRLLKQTYPSISSLHLTLDDIKNIEQNGRWWVLGAQYGQKEIDTNRMIHGNMNKKNNVMNILNNCDPKLLLLAKKMNMNTDVRKCILVILLTSKDYIEAYERLNSMNFKDLQQREVIKVLMECAAKEKTFNPYYGLLSVQLCKFNSSNRFTFQVSFWDFISDIQSSKQLRIINMAKLLEFLVQNFSLSLSMFKKIDFASLSDKAILFFITFFSTLIEQSSQETLAKVISRIAVGQDQALVRDGINLFLRTYMIGSLKGNDALLARVKLVSKQLDKLSSMDSLL